MPTYRQEQLKSGLFAGLKKGWRTFVWMCEIVVPISLAVTLLQWSGWLERMGFVLNPLMSLLHLPPEAALPIVTGMLINIYAVIATLAVIPFTIGQMTMIAVFNLIAHNLIMEGIIQHRSGINVAKITLVRIAAAVIAALAISPFLGDTGQAVTVPAALSSQSPLLGVLGKWLVDTAYLLLRILGIIVGIMVLQECLKSLGWLERIQRSFRGLMRVMGLSAGTTLTWLTAVIFGLLYGGAFIIEEARKGTLSRDELESIHVSIGINHSLIEDPFLFAVLGLNVLWLWVPRFIIAIVAVHAYRLVMTLRQRLRRAAA